MAQYFPAQTSRRVACNFGRTPALVEEVLGQRGRRTEQSALGKTDASCYRPLDLSPNGREAGPMPLRWPILGPRQCDRFRTKVSIGDLTESLRPGLNPITLRSFWELSNAVNIRSLLGGVETVAYVLDYVIVGSLLVQVGTDRP